MFDKFKLPHPKYTVKSSILLAAGFLLVVTGMFLMVMMSEHATRVFAARPVILFTLGLIFILTSVIFTNSGVFLYSGLFFAFSGIVFLLEDTHIVPYTMVELWPAIVICAGAALFPAGLYKLKRVRTIYLFPSILLILFGIIFLMFSIDVIKVSFYSFIARFWPVVIIFFGLALIVIFVIQQLNSSKFPYMKDDSLMDGDEN